MQEAIAAAEPIFPLTVPERFLSEWVEQTTLDRVCPEIRAGAVEFESHHEHNLLMEAMIYPPRPATHFKEARDMCRDSGWEPAKIGALFALAEHRRDLVTQFDIQALGSVRPIGTENTVLVPTLILHCKLHQMVLRSWLGETFQGPRANKQRRTHYLLVRPRRT